MYYRFGLEFQQYSNETVPVLCTAWSPRYVFHEKWQIWRRAGGVFGSSNPYHRSSLGEVPNQRSLTCYVCGDQKKKYSYHLTVACLSFFSTFLCFHIPVRLSAYIKFHFFLCFFLPCAFFPSIFSFNFSPLSVVCVFGFVCIPLSFCLCHFGRGPGTLFNPTFTKFAIKMHWNPPHP